MVQPRMRILAVCGVLAIFAAASARAQTTGKISGTVRVVNGEPVSGATVAVTNQQTGVAQTVTSGAGGIYEAPNLAPGLYTVSADVQGFRGQIVRDRRLEAGAALTVDINLQVKFSEAVTVTAMKREETVFSTPVSVAASGPSRVAFP